MFIKYVNAHKRTLNKKKGHIMACKYKQLRRGRPLYKNVFYNVYLKGTTTEKLFNKVYYNFRY